MDGALDSPRTKELLRKFFLLVELFLVSLGVQISIFDIYGLWDRESRVVLYKRVDRSPSGAEWTLVVVRRF